MLPLLQKHGYLVIVALLGLTLLSVALFLNAVLFPFLLACFLAYVLAPIIENLNQKKIANRRIPRGLAVLLVYLVILTGLFGGGTIMVPKVYHEMKRMVKTLPRAVEMLSETWTPLINEAVAKLETIFPQQETLPLPSTQESSQISANLASALENTGVPLDQQLYTVRQLESGVLELHPISPPFSSLSTKSPAKKKVATKKSATDLKGHLSGLMQSGLKRMQSDLLKFLTLGQQLVSRIAKSVFSIFLTLMVAAFILVDVKRINRFARSLVPPQHRDQYAQFLKKLDIGLNGVVRGQLLICVINGSFTFIGLVWIGVPFAFTLAIVATICSLIPIFGTIISSVPIVLMGLTVSFSTALLALGWILGIHFVEGNLLNPKIMGSAAEIHPVLIVFALMSGEYLAGIAGALLAVPVFSILQTMFLFFRNEILENSLNPSSSSATE